MCAFLLSSLQLIAQDWANLKRYQSENFTLTTPLKNENRVVFMGNSITQGWKEIRPDFFTNNSYICRGISGQTTPQMLVRFRQDVIALQPKVVVILAGTNDIAGNTGFSPLEMIMDNLSSMAELAAANKIKVVLCSVLPAFDYPWKKGMEPNIKIPKLNEMIKVYTAKKGFVYLDYFAAMNDGNNGLIEEYTTDGVHCTAKGYEFMESLVQPAILKALKNRQK
ncbi:MAG: SGNH/GDSL hydrolase family protein [Paludibacter sp.]|nr:SGNH/GDSL hydrolase family protein [Paludibacter sp.]